MLKHFCAALCLCLLPFAALGEEVLDLSQFEDAPEAAEWEERAWYQREDGSDWRLLDDGSVIVTVSATGDVTIGGDTRKSGKSIFDKQLAQEELGLDFPLSNVKSIFEADDLTLVNFEGTLTNTKSATKNTYSFAAPPEYVQVLTSASVEAVSLENNHVMDHGKAGYQDTCDTLSAAGVAYSGHLGASTFTTETGVKIGMLAYQTFNGNYKNIYAAIEGDIKALRDAGCALVVVSYHWGEEKDYVPNERQVPLGRATIDAGADLVVGHHSHRINPIELYNGKYIVYSLGNFCFAGNSKPDDMSTFVFQIKLRVKDGVASNDGFIIIPARISSNVKYNDFIPTPYTKQENIESVLSVLKKNGQKLTSPVTDYPLAWPDEE